MVVTFRHEHSDSMIKFRCCALSAACFPCFGAFLRSMDDEPESTFVAVETLEHREALRSTANDSISLNVCLSTLHSKWCFLSIK